MSHLPSPHEPSPQFRAHLEWETSRHFRREVLPALPPLRRGWSQIRAAAVIIVAVATGFAGSMVSAQVQEGRIREELLAAEEMRLKLADMRLELARVAAVETRQRFDTGIAQRESLHAAEANLQAMENQLAKVRLNLEEIRATADRPRDDLTAPLVGRRDNVTERLELELAVAQRQLAAAEAATADVERRFRVGAITELPLLEAQAGLVRREGDLAVLVGTRDLRQRFLQGSIEAAEVARLGSRLEMLREQATTEHLHRLAERRLTRVRQMWEARAVQQIELLRAELAVSELEADLQQMQRNLELLDRPAQ
jgi:hypothetical protein